MGGNALKNTFTRRYSAAEFYDLAANVIRKLREVYPDTEFNISLIKSYQAKNSFGDMDVLIAPRSDADLIVKPRHEDYEKVVRELFGPKELVRNTNVISFDVHQLQVDLIVCKADEYESSVNYFAYNDLGNLLGRLAHSLGLKLGHDGLSYLWRDKTYMFASENLTRDWPTILRTLKLDPARYDEGFETKREIFDYVASSAYFSPEIYLLHNRNNASRVRDRKRETYTEFLDYCEQQFPNHAVPVRPADKAYYLPALFEAIPGFAATYARVQSNYATALRAQEHFNGNLVRTWTGLQHQELGTFMRWLRHVRKFDHEQVTVLDNAEAVKLVVHEEYEVYKRLAWSEVKTALDAASVKHHATKQES